MPPRGRKPRPSYMRVLDGTQKAAAATAGEPQPEGKLEDSPPPVHLSDIQKVIWREAIKNAPQGMLTTLDESTLETWVVARSIHRDAAERVSKLGSLLKGKSGIPYQNPYLAILNKQATIMLRAAAEMGFTPSSRTRVKVTKPAGGGKSPGANPFGELRSLTDD